MNKKVSVIVNCHNGEKYLNECILSILNQKYDNLELIFFDNFSSDKTKEIIAQFKDNRIKYFFSDKKLSLYDARNKAIKFCDGEIIAFLDVDDWWDINYLSSRANVFDNLNYDYFYSNVFLFYEKTKKTKKYKKYNLPKGKIYNSLAKDYFIIISGLMIRRKVFDQIGCFNHNFNIIGDFDLIMRISKKFNAHAIQEPLIYYRYHQNNFSKLNKLMFYEEFKYWYNIQSEFNDQFFLNNNNYFKKKLLSLHIIHLLTNSDKNYYLFKKILKYPDFFKKIKYFLIFFTPKILIKYLIK
jgi:glycosyltransferase involved in cell wall biosynthesis